MIYRNNQVVLRCWSVFGTFALLSSATIVMTTSSFADETSAKALFKTMADYMVSQPMISFSYNANLEIVTADMMKVGLASSGTLALNRPGNIKMTRNGGFAETEMAYDGKTFGVFGKNLNVFATTEKAGTVDELIDTLRSDYDVEAPAADLLSANPYETMLSNVTNAIDLGSGVIDGQVCDHLAFRTAETDWQIWIAQGDRPYPCRFEITSKLTALAPSYRIDVSDWKTGTEVGDVKFQINAGDAKMVKLEELKDLDDAKALAVEGMSQ